MILSRKETQETNSSYVGHCYLSRTEREPHMLQGKRYLSRAEKQKTNSSYAVLRFSGRKEEEPAHPGATTDFEQTRETSDQFMIEYKGPF